MLREVPYQKKEIVPGEVFEYQMEITGKGCSAAIFPSKINHEKFDVTLVSSKISDFILDDTLFAHKTLKFEIAAKNGTAGTFKASDIFGAIKFYDPIAKSVQNLNPKLSILVKDKQPDETSVLSSDPNPSLLFLIDVSSSMMVEDLTPYRLAFVKNQLDDLASKGYSVEPIVFAGFPKTVRTKKKSISIKDIDFEMIDKKGTAMGDAIIYAIQFANTSNRNYSKKIFIIGDGDNTAGSIPAILAADYAKANGFTIYTIGVGSKGLVPFGTDSQGRKHLVSNTFSEKDFIMISNKTSGRYMNLKKDQDLEKILHDIIAKP